MSLKKILPLALLLFVVLPAQAFAAPKSKFRFTQATYVATEGQGHIDVTVTRTARHGHSRINQSSSVNFAVTGGSATQGVDYSLSPAPGKITFASGETTKTVTVNITQDTDIEGLESVNLKLSAASRNSLITNPRTTQVLIADDDGPTQVQLVPSSPNVNEASGSASFFAVRSGDITGNSAVHYATSDGSNADDSFNAHAPADYTAGSGDLAFGLGDFVQTIAVPIVDDTTIENPEDFAVTLSALTGATFPNGASSQTATTTIVDNDSPPVFALDASSYDVNENGSVDVTVQRLGNSAAPNPVSVNDVFNVNWATTDGTATNPADYMPSADQQLEFDATDDAETITISATDADTQIGLVDDTLAEGDEFFNLALTGAAIAPGGSGIAPSVGSPSSAVVTIKDDDGSPSGGGGTTGGGGGTTGGDTGTGTGSGTGTNPSTGEQIVLGARQSACGLTVKATKKQRLVRQKGLRIKLKSGQACKVSLSATVKQLASKKKKRQAQIVRALRFKGKKASLTVKPGKTKTVTVKFTRKTLKKINKALKAHKKFAATVIVTEKDAAGKTKRRSLKITIRR